MAEILLIVIVIMNVGIGVYIVFTNAKKQKEENKRLRAEVDAMRKAMEEKAEKIKSADPMEALLLKMIAETDNEDKAHLDQVRKAWNFQPVPPSKIDRMKGDN